MTKSNKFEHLEIKLQRFCYLSIKSWKFVTLKHTDDRFQTSGKNHPLRDTKNWNFKP